VLRRAGGAKSSRGPGRISEASKEHCGSASKDRVTTINNNQRVSTYYIPGMVLKSFHILHEKLTTA